MIKTIDIDFIVKIASVIATVQGIRYTEAQINKIKAETKKIEAEIKK